MKRPYSPPKIAHRQRIDGSDAVFLARMCLEFPHLTDFAWKAAVISVTAAAEAWRAGRRASGARPPETEGSPSDEEKFAHRVLERMGLDMIKKGLPVQALKDLANFRVEPDIVAHAHYRAIFEPRRRDDLVPGGDGLIGQACEWVAGWILEDGNYAGEWAMIYALPAQYDLPFAWVPSGDLRFLERLNPDALV